jgi:hypothetical protein
MRYNSPSDALVLQRMSAGPAAIAARARTFQQINAGLKQKPFVDAAMIRQGGSLGDVTAAYSKPKRIPTANLRMRLPLGGLGDVVATYPIRHKIARRNIKVPARMIGYRGLGATNTGSVLLQTVGGITGTGGIVGAAKGAATGAGIGTTIFPGLGTAIGAAVGAIVGGLLHFGTGAQRLATANQIIASLQAQPPPLTAGRQQTLQVITECYGALVSTHNFFGYVRPSPANSPSDIQHEFDSMMKTITGLVQLMNSQPIGSTVTYSATGFNGIPFSLSFVNPGTSNTATVLQTATIPAMTAWLTQMGRVDISNVGNDFAKPIVQLVFGLMTDYVIGQNPAPGQVTAIQAAIAAPVQVAPTQVVTAPVITPSAPASSNATIVANSSSQAPTPIYTGSASFAPVSPVITPVPAALTAPAFFSSGSIPWVPILIGAAAVLLLTRNQSS